MAAEVIAVFIPIIFFLVIGLILVTFFYFRSREKQLLIEKGMEAQAIKELYARKKDPFVLLKFGIIITAFGLGLGIGLILQDNTMEDYWVPLFLFVFTGIGFIIANIITRKLEKNV
ncbi:MAG TPA: DUF6249 domain-containing protein [Ignavibacteriaceae bacterium]|nr:DUF6249 domain-containing protein [Ignavibacteriaceae bacterium]